ncbi:MAG: hypothetical protein GX890_07480 [Firmicutes bacterium]|nr:hypothetical protein [Bacillota bacterium]
MGDDKSKLEKFGKGLERAGSKMQQLGCALTLLITLPVGGLLIFGPVGGIIGGVIGVLVFVGIFMAK